MPTRNVRSTSIQMITFAIEYDPDQPAGAVFFVRAKQNSTIQQICALRGHPEMAMKVAKVNGVRSITARLKHGERIKLPATLKQSELLHVPADDPPPVPTAGYAKFQVVDRIGATGILQFTGYDPITLPIPIQFLAQETTAPLGTFFGPQGSPNSGEGTSVESDCALLERMAGRGPFTGAAQGPPCVLRISSTRGDGSIAPLIPASYQWSAQNPAAPLFRITDIAWDATPRRNDEGRRTVQKCVVTLQQYTPLFTGIRSTAKRNSVLGQAEQIAQLAGTATPSYS